MLVVTEKKAAVALALIAAHGIDTDLLAAAVIVLAFIYIFRKRERRGEEMSHLELVGHRYNHYLHQLMKGFHPVVPYNRDTVWGYSVAPGYDGTKQGHPIAPCYGDAAWWYTRGIS